MCQLHSIRVNVCQDEWDESKVARRLASAVIPLAGMLTRGPTNDSDEKNTPAHMAVIARFLKNVLRENLSQCWTLLAGSIRLRLFCLDYCQGVSKMDDNISLLQSGKPPFWGFARFKLTGQWCPTHTAVDWILNSARGSWEIILQHYLSYCLEVAKLFPSEVIFFIMFALRLLNFSSEF